jgi:diacylglycerol kinase
MAGITWAFRSQRNVRIQMAVAVAVICTAFAIEVPLTQIVIFVLAITVVLVAELLNSAIEAAIDLVTPEVHPLAKIAKDAAAGAVLLAAAGAAIVGVIIFFARVYTLLLGAPIPGTAG